MIPKTVKSEVLRVLEEVVKDHKADGLLLSGGLDTSIIAYLASKHFKPTTLTVGFSQAETKEDTIYARMVAETYGLKNILKLFSVKEAKDAARHVVKILKTFDAVEVRNDIPIYIGLKWFKDHGFHSILTGDGGDELFAGYSFLFQLKAKEIEEWIKEVTKRWSFASSKIGKNFGLRVLQPFTDQRIVDLALKIPAQYKIAQRNGIVYGKFVLRSAFEGLIPDDILWREKQPIEQGSGSVSLRKIFKVSLEKYQKLSKFVKDHEHAFYLQLYLEEVCL